MIEDILCWCGFSLLQRRTYSLLSEQALFEAYSPFWQRFWWRLKYKTWRVL